MIREIRSARAGTRANGRTRPPPVAPFVFGLDTQDANLRCDCVAEEYWIQPI